MDLLRLSRLVVIGSTLTAVAAGLWPLASMPAVLASLAAIFLGVAAAARWRPDLAAVVVLVFAYTNYGIARMIVGAELASMPYWLAAFAGLAVGGASWQRWEAQAGWRVPLAWWATSVALTWPFFAARDLGFSLAPSLAAGPTVVAAATQMSLALWMDGLLARREPAGLEGEDRRLRVSRWAWPLAASAMLTSAAAVYQRFGDRAWLSGEPWVGLHRSVGMMGDANPVGVASALWAPLTWMLAAGSLAGTIAGGGAAVVLWAAAWFSGARTTIILVAAGLCGLVLAAAWARERAGRIVLGAAAGAGMLVGVVAVMAVPRATPESPIGRLVATVPTESPRATLYELLWRRDGYGLAAIEAIKEHPIVGVGVGRFTRLSTGYYQRLTGQTIPPDNAQSFWRHTFAEQGVMGLLPILWLTALACRSVLSRAATRLGLVMRVMLAGIGVALVFGYPLQDTAIAVTVGTLVAVVERDRLSRPSAAAT